MKILRYVTPPMNPELWGHIVQCELCGHEWKAHLGDGKGRATCPRCFAEHRIEDAVPAWRLTLARGQS